MGFPFDPSISYPHPCALEDFHVHLLVGNDLARVLGWGGGLSNWVSPAGLGSQTAQLFLEEVERATPVMVDRWTVQCHSVRRCICAALLKSKCSMLVFSCGTFCTGTWKQEIARKTHYPCPRQHQADAKLPGACHSALWTCDLSCWCPTTDIFDFFQTQGVGVDAQCALDFHLLRGESPGWFKSQFVNKYVGCPVPFTQLLCFF